MDVFLVLFFVLFVLFDFFFLFFVCFFFRYVIRISDSRMFFMLEHTFTHIVFKLLFILENVVGRLFDRWLARTLRNLSCSYFLIVGILKFSSMKNTMSENLSRKNLYCFQHFSSYEQLEVNVHLPPSPPHQPLDETFWIFTRVVELSRSHDVQGAVILRSWAINGALSAALSQFIPPLPTL